jgi:hypothetical protein
MADPFAAVNNAMILGGMYGPNQYSQFQGRMPFPGYVGTPTDALGRPIQMPQQTPGTTLNSTPAAAAAPPSGATDYSTSNPAYANYLKGHPAGSQMTAGGQIPSGGSSAAPTNVPPTMMPGVYGQQSPTAAPQSSGVAPGSLNNALAALSNPGPVTTPGATVPQSTVGSQPSVLQQFLANKQGGTGAGNYSNQGFFDTLNALGKA